MKACDTEYFQQGCSSMMGCINCKGICDGKTCYSCPPTNGWTMSSRDGTCLCMYDDRKF